jgi:hypothetical protein
VAHEPFAAVAAATPVVQNPVVAFEVLAGTELLVFEEAIARREVAGEVGWGGLREEAGGCC